MNKHLLGAATAAIIFTAGAAFAQSPPAPAPSGQPMPRAHFTKTQTRADVQAHVARMFTRLDANHDRFITKDEIAAAEAQFAGKRRGQEGPGQPSDRSRAFNRIDANHDGMISRDEFAAAPRPDRGGMHMAGMHRGFAGHMFEVADGNKDGKVSLAEAQQAALQHFDKADLNHDGKLTPQERQQARQLLRAERRPS
jgi:Ca2+-binding EF-hand superfamily protein